MLRWSSPSSLSRLPLPLNLALLNEWTKSPQRLCQMETRPACRPAPGYRFWAADGTVPPRGIVLVAPNTDAASHQKRAVVSRWVNEIHCSKQLFGEHRATLSGKQHLFAQKQQFFGHRRTVIRRVHVEVVELVGHPLRSNEAGRGVEEPRAHICVGSR